METLGKKEVAEIIAKEMYGDTCSHADKSFILGGIDDLLDYLEFELKRDNKIYLYGFGALVPAHKNARIGRNPKSGTPHEISARKTVRLVRGPYENPENVSGKVNTTEIKTEMTHYFKNYDEASEFINLFISQLKRVLTGDYRFEFRMFGVFRPNLLKGRHAINPKTREKVITEDAIRPHFKVSKKLVERLTDHAINLGKL